jgi:NADH-quinone oxidoreductase subunit G
MIEITLDGKKIEVREGSMVMDAANQVGTYIPHFCYHKKLSIAANCRMCLVEVEKAPKPLPACATPVTAGMVVRTASDKAIQAQKGVMEFLLINHPLDCPICDQGGECQLQDLAVGYGGSGSRYKEEKRVVFHKDAGPLVAMEEMTRCIHCTRCVRFGQEIAGVMELGMLNRGEFAEITTFVGKTVDSELSGNMIDICPVGALTSKPFRYAARTWELSRRKSISPHDALGANLIVQVKNQTVMRVLPLENEDINECWLSDKDRFSYEGLNSPDRLTMPMVREDSTSHPADWPDALEAVAVNLKRLIEQHGANAFGVIASPHSTLEELYLLQKLTRGLASSAIDARLRLQDDSADATRTMAPWLGMSVKDFGHIDRALVIGSFLRKDQPLLAQRLRQIAKRGARVWSLHATADDWLMPMAGQVVVAPSRWLFVLAQIATGVAVAKSVTSPLNVEPDDVTKKLAADLVSGRSRAVMLGAAAQSHPAAAQIRALAEWIANATGARLVVLPEAANSVGAHLVGAVSGAPGSSVPAQFKAKKHAFLLFNCEPEFDTADPALALGALHAADMVVMFSPFASAGASYADVQLPIAPFTETSGSFVNCEGRLQSFYGTVPPLGETRPGWKVLRVLGNLLGLEGFGYESSDQILAEINAALGDIKERLGNLSGVAIKPLASAEASSAGAGLERIADVPIHFADSLVRRAAALQRTTDARAPELRINGQLALKLKLASGARVRVTQGDGHAELITRIDPGVADDTVRIASAHISTAALGAMIGPVSVEVLEHAEESA